MTSWVGDGSLLIICLARPELLDVRSDWGGGLRELHRVRAARENESEQLIDALAQDGDISPETRRALLEKTEGNPLFLEEVMLSLAESGEKVASAGIPDTLQALIAARIDRLEPPSKAFLQRASVIGRSFWACAIPLLGRRCRRSRRGPALRDLVVGGHAPRSRTRFSYRFKHVLIRDVAYASLPKSARATHHARFADWLGERAGGHCSRSAPTTSNRQRRCWPSSMRRWLSWPRKLRRRCKRRACPRPRGEPGGAPRVPASRSLTTLERRYSRRRCFMPGDDLPAGSPRWSARRPVRSATRGSKAGP